MSDPTKKDSSKKNENSQDPKQGNTIPLDDSDISLLKRYGLGPYAAPIKVVEDENKELLKNINKLSGIKESDTGLSLPSQWDFASDK